MMRGPGVTVRDGRLAMVQDEGRADGPEGHGVTLVPGWVRGSLQCCSVSLGGTEHHGGGMAGIHSFSTPGSCLTQG